MGVREDFANVWVGYREGGGGYFRCRGIPLGSWGVKVRGYYKKSYK